MRWGLAVGVALGLVALWAWPRLPPPEGPLLTTEGTPFERIELVESASAKVEFRDGSRIEASGPTEFVGIESSRHRQAFLLRRGRVTIEVRPGGPRRWVIEAGLARVEVLGTRFSVTRRPDRVEVAVERGVVLVSSPHLEDGVARLEAGAALALEAPGEAGAAFTFEAPSEAEPPPVVSQTPPGAGAVAGRSADAASVGTQRVESRAGGVGAPPEGRSLARPKGRGRRSSPRVRPARPAGGRPASVRGASDPRERRRDREGGSRPEVEAGVVESAQQGTPRGGRAGERGGHPSRPVTGPARAPGSPAEPGETSPVVQVALPKWSLADVDAARARGDVRGSAGILQSIEADDERASAERALAAFMLGRLQLEELDAPSAARRAFERALALGLPPSLERSARARAVVARAAEGESEAAQDGARAFFERYPGHSADHELVRSVLTP